jgi:hypothetical protein
LGVDLSFGNSSTPKKTGEVHERIGSLGRPAGRRSESPREVEAQEGRGLEVSLNRSFEVRTLTGSKALKWGVRLGVLSR